MSLMLKINNYPLMETYCPCIANKLSHKKFNDLILKKHVLTQFLK